MAQLLIQRVLHSPFGFQIICLTFLFCFLLGFRPPYSQTPLRFETISSSVADQYLRVSEPGFLENSVGVNTAGLRQIMVEDESGQKVIMKKRDSTIFYTIKPGDSAWTIAHKLGLKPQTVLWANDLTALSKLTVGEKLKIPPTDGVYYKVQSRDTLGEVAKAHRVDIQKIKSYNGISGDTIKAGQELFIPGADKIFIAQKPAPIRNNIQNSRNIQTTTSTGSLGSIGVNLIRPTRGVLTQGFKRNHYGIDIANKMNTPIYTSGAGTVKLAKSGGWNYGYGNYIIIDHGNGVESLYAHNNINKVTVGDQVKSGQLIALMGNTGRVFGVTGIHLHYELRIRGRKVNPYNYFQ